MTFKDSPTVFETSIPDLNLLRRGKVRDVYEIDDDSLLFIATDRISAFDCILPTPIPLKGRVLTSISLFWFDLLKPVIENHLLTSELERMPKSVRERPEVFQGRTMMVKRARVFPIECVVRGYLAGSGWKDYLRTGEVCGHILPAGLHESRRLKEPIFTPATKAETGHDENISFDKMSEIVGVEAATKLRDVALELYGRASDYALSRGIIIADTKFEMGIDDDGKIILVDEVLTPDSSRFWPADSYAEGGSQPSFDKQYVRDYLETLDWDKTPPAPALPDTVARATTERYLEAFRRLTGTELQSTS
jgi:phosphoribosylaminoimidazole-succinocarboxamide synthase